MGRQCGEQYPHDAHFYIVAICGGPAGPTPTEGYVCPGLRKEEA